jgi:TM2 domain-containing membrane protein YozV
MTDNRAMKQDWVAYLLAACSVFGFAGLHRFYLNRPVSGFLYLVTWGCFGLGTLHDLVRMRKLVARANAGRLGGSGELHVHIHGPAAAGQLGEVVRESAALLDGAAVAPSPEQRAASRERGILQCARAHGGTITTALVALEVNLPLRKAEKELHRLRDGGFCSLDVSEDGAEIFTFRGLGSTRPLDL